MDVNGDGYLDVVTGGWFGQELRWLENPRGSRESNWREHPIARCGSIETTRAWDIDGDGELEIVPNTPNDPQRAFKLRRDTRGDPSGSFDEFILSVELATGSASATSTVTAEIILCDGWLVAPEDPLGGEYVLEPGPALSLASVPILVVDLDGDGVAELIVGNAHDYGLNWWKRTG